MQVALAEYLQVKETYLSLGKLMQEKRDYFIELMTRTKFKLLNSSGSYFIAASYKEITDEADLDFAIRLTKESGIATIPLSAFYQDGKDDKVLRFCFAKKDSTLEAAAEKLSMI
jgi:methionine aminotransferase